MFLVINEVTVITITISPCKLTLPMFLIVMILTFIGHLVRPDLFAHTLFLVMEELTLIKRVCFLAMTIALTNPTPPVSFIISTVCTSQLALPVKLILFKLTVVAGLIVVNLMAHAFFFALCVLLAFVL